VNIAEMNAQYEKVGGFLSELERIDKRFREENGIGEVYASPFHQEINMKKLIRELRNDLTKFAIRRLAQEHCPNVAVDAARIKKEMDEKCGDSGFDAGVIAGYIQTQYLPHVAKLSWKRILDDARKLLPVVWGDFGRENVCAKEIQKKKTLSLRMYVGEYGWGIRTDELIAIEQLVRVVLGGEDPVRVEGRELAEAYQHSDELYEVHDVDVGKLRKARLYKNGKLLLYFEDEDAARKVAMALTNGHYRGRP